MSLMRPRRPFNGRWQARPPPKANVSQARATLEAKETDLSKLVIYSPVDGIVLNRNVEPARPSRPPSRR